MKEITFKYNQDLRVGDNLPTGSITRAQKEGWVYLVKSENGLYKIGMTKRRLADRMSQYTSYPVRIYLIASWRCEDAADFEQMMLTGLMSYRVRGDWFDPPAKLIDSIIEHTKRMRSGVYYGD